MTVIDDYLKNVTAEERAALERVRTITKKAAPDAEEAQSYGMPAFKYKGKPLLGLTASKNHLSIFPFSPAVIEGLKDQLEGYELLKGTIHFTLDKPLPDTVIQNVVTARVKEINT